MYNKIFNEEEWRQVNKENIEIMEDFLLELKARGKKQTTIDQYRNDLRIVLIYILRYCGNKSLLDLTKRNFRNFILWTTQEMNVSAARSNRLMSAIRSMLSYVEDSDEYEYDINAAAKVKGMEENPVRDIVFLSDEGIMKLLEELEKRKDYRRATLVALAYESAGRKGELAQVQKYCFLDDTKNSTNIVIGKRGKKFPLIYFDLAKKYAKLYLEQRGEDDVPELFVVNDGGTIRPATSETLYGWIVASRHIWAEVNGDFLTYNVHSFRHSALENYNQGTHEVCRSAGTGAIPIEKLRLIANHNDLSTTQGYLDNHDTDELEALFNIKIN